MLQLNIRINTVNAAFDGDPKRECARILRTLADKLESGAVCVPRDINGNKCGDVEIVTEYDEVKS